MSDYDDIINYEFDIKTIKDLLTEAQDMSAAEKKITRLYELQLDKWKIILDNDSQKPWYEYELLLAELLTSRNYLMLEVSKLELSSQIDEYKTQKMENYNDSILVDTMLATKLCVLINKIKKNNKVLGKYRDMNHYKKAINCSNLCIETNCYNCKNKDCDIHKSQEFIDLCEANINNDKMLYRKIS